MDFEKSLNELCWELVIEQPFYGLFLTELNKRFTNDPSLSTACVAKAPGSINVSLLIDQGFWKTYLKNDSQRKYILLHETLHVIFDHFFFRDLRPDHLIDNIACDITINQFCDQKYERPQDGQFLENYKELNLKPMESTQYYYEQLLAAKQKKENSEGKTDSLAGPKGNKNGSSGCKQLDELLDNDPGDWHKQWETITKDMTDMEKKLLQKQIESAIREVAEQIEKQRGEIPAHLKDIVAKALHINKPIVEWKTLFRQFVGSAMNSDPYRTRKKPNLRFEDSPVTRHKPKVRGIFAIDQSGSMGENDIQEGNSELYHIWKSGVKIDLAEWDCECNPAREYKGKLEYERVKGGGTRLGCAIEYVNENKKNYDFAVFFTDGYIESDIPVCKVPCLILITSSGTTELNTSHKILKMNH